MNEAKHTPGPWHVADDDPYAIRSDDWGGIGFVHNEPAENKEIMAMKEADACLIAAAPDLLEACRRSIMALAANDAPNCEAAKECKAAIAKATA